LLVLFVYFNLSAWDIAACFTHALEVTGIEHPTIGEILGPCALAHAVGVDQVYA
jgi:hypothetical protein